MAKKKISAKDFLRFFHEGLGIYSVVAELIEKHTGESYTRDAVQSRVNSIIKKNPHLLKQMTEAKIDRAEQVIMSLMASPNKNIALKAAELVATHLGKDRGYVKRTQVNSVDKDGNDSLPSTFKVQIVPPLER